MVPLKKSENIVESILGFLGLIWLIKSITQGLTLTQLWLKTWACIGHLSLITEMKCYEKKGSHDCLSEIKPTLDSVS